MVKQEWQEMNLLRSWSRWNWWRQSCSCFTPWRVKGVRFACHPGDLPTVSNSVFFLVCPPFVFSSCLARVWLFPCWTRVRHGYVSQNDIPVLLSSFTTHHARATTYSRSLETKYFRVRQFPSCWVWPLASHDSYCLANSIYQLEMFLILLKTSYSCALPHCLEAKGSDSYRSKIWLFCDDTAVSERFLSFSYYHQNRNCNRNYIWGHV